jgi:hypothetical protein
LNKPHRGKHWKNRKLTILAAVIGVANATARDATAEAGKKASTEKSDAAYAVEKEKCDSLAGDAQDTCIKQAKSRRDQS